MLLTRCTAATAGNAATATQQQQREADVLASTSKAKAGSRTNQGGRKGAAAGAPAVADAVHGRSCPDQQQQGPQQLVQLTEASIAAMQQQQQQHLGCSPAKRSQPFLVAAAAAGGDADADGSPIKKHRGGGSLSQPGPAGGVTTRSSSGFQP